uniref:TPR_REGION domain-containing protein n=1 Tax=Trichobilharzia regenti TaxID=157069 RepID=A0AA85ITX8_TRIRE|nr:unnamed protein product [Trichobilharzia regenti]
MEKDLSYGEVVGNTNKSGDVNPRNTAVQVKKGEEEVHKNSQVPGTTSILSSYFTKEITADEDPFESVCESNTTDGLIKESESTEKSVSLKNIQPEVKQDTASLNRLRQRDAWLPSESTRNALLNRNTPTKPAEIKPVLMGKDYEIVNSNNSGGGGGSLSTFADPFHYLLVQFMGDEPGVNAIRRAPSIEQVNQNVDGLKELIANGWYTCALSLTYRILSNMGFEEGKGGSVLTPYTAQIWLTRLALLVRTRNYELAERELATFQNLDAPNVYFEYTPELYPGRTGSIIPFSLRLLHAELPFHLNRPTEALDRLYYLHAIIVRIRSNLEKGFKEDGLTSESDPVYRQTSMNLWKSREIRLLSSCLSIFLQKFDYQSAIQVVHQISCLHRDNQAALRGFCSLLGRIYLQFGDLETAKAYFDKSISGIVNGSSSSCCSTDSSCNNDSTQLLIRKSFQNGLLCIAKGEYQEAKKLFVEVLRLDPTNVAAANNLAICGLYLGQLTESIEALEKLTTIGLTNQSLPLMPSIDNTQSRRFCLHDVMISNLTVLYEVESDSALMKKLNLLKKLIKLPGEPVHISSFKLPVKQ